MAAEPGLLEELVYHKLVSGMSTPVINERLVHSISLEGHVHKHLEQLRNRLAKAQERTCRRLENARFKLFLEPGAGQSYISAPPADASVDTLALCQGGPSEGHPARPRAPVPVGPGAQPLAQVQRGPLRQRPAVRLPG